MSLITVRAALVSALADLDASSPPPPPNPYAWAVTDRTPRPKPPVPRLGPPGWTFADPTFGAKILRVTDHQIANGASWTVPSNAHLAAWSADSTKFYVMGDAGKRIYTFDPGTFTAVSRGTVISQPEPQFSRVDPDGIFVGAGPVGRTLQRYSLSKKTYTTVLELDSLGLPLATPRTYCGGIYSSAGAEVLVAMFGGEQADLHRYVVWLPLDGHQRKVIDTQTDPRIPAHWLHSASIDLSGRYVVLYPTGALSPAIAKKILWDTTTDTFTLLPETSARMGGHDALGYGTMINMEGASVGQPWDAAQWVVRSLATPIASMVDVVNPVLTPKVTTLEDHTSYNHAQPDRVVPVLSSTFHSGPITGWRAWDDELLAIDPHAGGTIARFMHTRSVITSDFWTQPIAITSPDGRYAIVHSTWEDTLGLDPGGHPRTDVFLVELARG